MTIVKSEIGRRNANDTRFIVPPQPALPRPDAVVALTSPPLISFIGACYARLRGGRFYYWVMDLNPDEAIAAGWLNESSITARLLSKCLAHSLRVAEKTIVLDRFMKVRIVEKGVPERKVVVVPPWSLTTAVRFDQQGRLAFRERYGLSQKFVVMYAGNHSPCHPLGTLLEAAQQLSPHNDIAFCFVGGGSELKKVQAFAAQQQLHNIICVPYQSLEQLAGTLSAADLHAVVMGERFVGIVHPCKIYNVLAVGSPFLYIGPEESHITDIAGRREFADSTYLSSHGASESVANHITRAVERCSPDGRGKSAAASAVQCGGRQDICAPSALAAFSRESLLPEMIDLLERAATTPTIKTAAVSQTSV